MVIAYIQDLLISNNDINYVQAAGKYFRFMNGLICWVKSTLLVLSEVGQLEE